MCFGTYFDFLCCDSQLCEAITAMLQLCVGNRDEKDGNSYLSCVCVWMWYRPKYVCERMCVLAYEFVYMYVWDVLVSVIGSRLSPSLHPDSSVKQGLI